MQGTLMTMECVLFSRVVRIDPHTDTMTTFTTSGAETRVPLYPQDRRCQHWHEDNALTGGEAVFVDVVDTSVGKMRINHGVRLSSATTNVFPTAYPRLAARR